MAFRRTSSSRGRSFSFRSRFRRPQVRTPTRPSRWQFANLSLFNEGIHQGAPDPANHVMVVAQIHDHLGDEGTAAGRLGASLARRLEIGGIVFSWNLWHRDFPAPEGNANAAVQHQLILCTDRVAADGAPAAILTNWSTNTTPIPLASASDVEDEDVQFPTRVHWRAGNTADTGSFQQGQAGGGAHTDFANRLSGSANLRLRLSLTDTDVLAFHWFTSPLRLNSGEEVVTYMSVVGSLYYRVRY